MATTKVTSNLLAPSAAQANINSGDSLTLSVPTQVNNTLTTNNKVVIDSASAVANPKMLIMATATQGVADGVPLVIKGSGVNKLASINLRSTGGSGELYDAWLSGKVGGGIQVNNSFTVSSGNSGPITGSTIFIVQSTGGVGIGVASPNTKAALDITSTTKGFLPPRMTTTERNAIATPPAGLVIYNTTTNNLNSYSGSAWVELVDSADLGTGIPTFLADPTSENLANALADTTGTGGVVLQDGATLTGPYLEGPVDIGGQDADGVDRVMTRSLADTRYGQKVYSTISTTSSTVLNTYDVLFSQTLPIGYYRFEYHVFVKNNEVSSNISPRIRFSTQSGTISVDGVRQSIYNQGTYVQSCFRNVTASSHDGGNVTVGSPNFTEGSLKFFGYINVSAQAVMQFLFSHNTSAPTNPTTVEGHLVLEYLTAS